MPRPRPEEPSKPYACEADLCADFIGCIGKGWTAYPETAGWDVLLVRDDGVQIGIEAKLRLNTKVLLQACDTHSKWDGIGPDFTGALIPDRAASSEMRALAKLLGVTVIELRASLEYRRLHDRIYPRLPRRGDDGPWGWEPKCPTQRCPLPGYVPDVVAGASAPVQLTPWKIAALRLAILLERRGFVTRADFKRVGIDPSRWIRGPYAWLQPEPDGRGFVARAMPPFREQHPRVWGEIAADFAKWAPADMKGAA